jgi:hypothetical protein
LARDFAGERACVGAACFLLNGSLSPMKRVMFRLGSELLFVLAALLASACSDTYCQSGPKYGTQCRTINDVEWQRTQQREEPWPAARATEPTPGCALVSPGGVVQQPYGAGSSGAPSNLPPRYLMSAACASRQQPVYGAVR